MKHTNPKMNRYGMTPGQIATARAFCDYLADIYPGTTSRPRVMYADGTAREFFWVGNDLRPLNPADWKDDGE